MRELMDERTRAIEGEDRHQAAAEREPGRAGEHRSKKPKITKQRRAKHVSPEDGVLGRVEVSRETRRRLEHRGIVPGARRRRLKLSRAVALALDGRCLGHDSLLKA